jgi:hypothetical protein
MHRTSREVAARAILCGTLGFRESLEVTEHPRSKALCAELLPWLERFGLADRMEAVHRELLQSPHGKLPAELRTEAFWQGEAASLLGWAIRLFDKPDSTASIDPGLLVSNFRILQPTVGELVSSAELRPQPEIEDYCAFCLAVRHQHQLSALDGEGQAVLSRIHQSKLAGLGLAEALHRLDPLQVKAIGSASNSLGATGLYVVRGLTAEWLLTNDASA